MLAKLLIINPHFLTGITLTSLCDILVFRKQFFKTALFGLSTSATGYAILNRLFDACPELLAQINLKLLCVPVHNQLDKLDSVFPQTRANTPNETESTNRNSY